MDVNMEKSEVDRSIDAILNFNLTSSEGEVGNLIDCYRTLRSYCATGSAAQNYLANCVQIIEKTKEVINLWLGTLEKTNELCLLVALQFLANFLVDNVNNQRLIWSSFQNILFQAIRSCQPKIKNCVAMIIYNIFLDNDDCLKECYGNLAVIFELTQLDMTSEYATFIVELLICKTDFIEKHYGSSSIKNKLIIISVIETIQKSSDQRRFPSGVFKYFSQHIIHRFNCVLNETETEAGEFDVIEVTSILHILNNASCCPHYIEEVQSVTKLLNTVIELLKTVHALSKERGNQFSMLLKLSDVEAMERTNNVNDHPTFGLKGSLVRLVGNMCWHHKKHQDLAREMGAIPLILDCCNIDAKNPFIIQWAVLAMRNLCEDNIENQKVVACIDRNGRVDSSRLAQLGLIFNSSAQHQ